MTTEKNRTNHAEERLLASVTELRASRRTVSENEGDGERPREALRAVDHLIDEGSYEEVDNLRRARWWRETGHELAYHPNAYNIFDDFRFRADELALYRMSEVCPVLPGAYSLLPEYARRNQPGVFVRQGIEWAVDIPFSITDAAVDEYRQEGTLEYAHAEADQAVRDGIAAKVVVRREGDDRDDAWRLVDERRLTRAQLRRRYRVIARSLASKPFPDLT